MTCLELCSGCGGMSLGLQDAGFEHLLLVEQDNHCVETLKANGCCTQMSPLWISNHTEARSTSLRVGYLASRSASAAWKVVIATNAISLSTLCDV